MFLLDASLFFRGAPRPFFLLHFYPFFWWNLLFHRSVQESLVSLLHFVRGRSGAGQLLGSHRKERPLRCFTPWTAHSCPTLPLIKLPPLWPFTSAETQEVSGLFARTLGRLQGSEISFTRAPINWTVTNEACLMTSMDEWPWAVLGVPTRC